MLIGIISDTHLPRGDRALPPDCVERLRGTDLILHAGDVVSASTLAEIELIGPPVLAVLGNRDDPDLQRELPPERTVEAGATRIAMIHDAGAREGRLRRMRRHFPDADAVVFGHSHIPLHEAEDGFHIFNPGSPTDKRREPRFTMGLARVENTEIGFEIVTVG